MVWAEHVTDDILSHAEDMGVEISKEDAEILAESYVCDGEYDKFPYGKPQTDEVARGSGNREYGCQRLREKLPNVRESLFLEPGIPIV